MKKLNNKIIKYIKKYICILSVPVLLCGCAPRQDSIVMELSQENVEQDMTEQAAGHMDSRAESSGSENMTQVPYEEREAQMVYVYLCGAVLMPGVYRLEGGSRLYEAVEMAGGLAADADDTCLNMAREIVDGEQIVVLTQEETALLRESGGYPTGDMGQQTSAMVSGLVNINTAGVAELTTVSGIGESRAQAIIAYREKNGAFRSIDEIKKVEGIKDGLFSKIKDFITI